MANFGNQGGRKTNKPASGGPPAVPSTFQIVEPRCKVCKFANRREIDVMLATGWSQAAVLEYWNNVMSREGQEDYFNPMNISNHARKHLGVQDAAVRRILEERARAEGVDIETVENTIRTKTGTVETLIAGGLESLHHGHTVVEPKVILDAIKMLTELEEKNSEILKEEMMREIRAFMAAVKKNVPDEMWETIFEDYAKELKKTSPKELTTPQTIPTPPPIIVEGEVIEEKEKSE